MACFNVPTKSCKTHSVPYTVEVTNCDELVRSCQIIKKQTIKKVMVPFCEQKCQIMEIEAPKKCERKCKDVKVPYKVKEAYCSWEQKCVDQVPVATSVSNSLEIFDMLY